MKSYFIKQGGECNEHKFVFITIFDFGIMKSIEFRSMFDFGINRTLIRARVFGSPVAQFKYLHNRSLPDAVQTYIFAC